MKILVNNVASVLVLDFNCTPPAVGEFPKDIFSKTQLQNGAIIIHILFTIYLFTAIAIICDEYFVPVVEKLCHSKILLIHFFNK